MSRAQDSQKAAQQLASVAALLNGLMRRFKIERRDARLAIPLPVRIATTDIDGHPIDEEVVTVNVSRNGALLRGIRAKLQPGGNVSLARSNKQEQFLIAWVGEKNTPKAGQIGVSAIQSASSFWSDVLEAQSQDDLTTEEDADSQKTAQAKARAQGA